MRGSVIQWTKGMVIEMKISTKGRYALRMLTDLAENQGDGCVSLTEIAERQGISKKYLEQIVPMLSKARLIRTIRGNRGGYRLNADPEKCTVGDVIRATEGSLAPVACLEFPENSCPRKEQCSTLFVWEGYYKLTENYFNSITIQDIINRNLETAQKNAGSGI